MANPQNNHLRLSVRQLSIGVLLLLALLVPIRKAEAAADREFKFAISIAGKDGTPAYEPTGSVSIPLRMIITSGDTCTLTMNIENQMVLTFNQINSACTGAGFVDVPNYNWTASFELGSGSALVDSSTSKIMDIRDSDDYKVDSGFMDCVSGLNGGNCEKGDDYYHFQDHDSTDICEGKSCQVPIVVEIADFGDLWKNVITMETTVTNGQPTTTDAQHYTVDLQTADSDVTVKVNLNAVQIPGTDFYLAPRMEPGSYFWTLSNHSLEENPVTNGLITPQIFNDASVYSGNMGSGAFTNLPELSRHLYAGDDQFIGTFRYTYTTDLAVYPRNSATALIPYKSVSREVQVQTLDDDSYVNFEVTFINGEDNSPVDITSGGDLVQLIAIDTPAPVTAHEKDGNKETVTEITPSYYEVRFSNPSGGFIGYKGAEDANVASFDLTSDRDTEIVVCPVYPALFPPEDIPECETDNDMEEEEPEDLDDEGSDSTIDIEADLCVPEEMLQGPLGWILRPLFLTFCNMIEISTEFAFPLLDVNIPLVKGGGGNSTIVELRPMFGEDMLPPGAQNSLQSLLPGATASLFTDAWTPAAVYELWLTAWALSRTFVILMIVIFAYLIMFRIDTNKYTHRTLVSNTLFAVFMAAFSYTLCTFMFDLNKIVALVIKDTLLAVFTRYSPTTEAVWDSTFMSNLSTGIWGAVLGSMWVALAIPCVCCIFGYIGTLIVLFLLLIARMLFLYIMVIVSPIVFTMAIIPEFKSIYKSWFKSLFGVLSIYPLAVLVYYLLSTLAHFFA